jgi:hypothetical protein
MSTVEEIERAVKKLPQEDFAKLSAWMERLQAETPGHVVGAASKSSSGWFDIYMACPHSLKIPPRRQADHEDRRRGKT